MAMLALLVSVNLFVREVHPVGALSLSEPLVALGTLLTLMGLAIRSWAAGTLHKAQQLTTTGPYALMRNPLYFGSLLMLLGFGAIVRDWPTLVILTVPLVVIYLLTVRHEERRMAALFPDAWPAYRDRTPRFIPYRPIMPRLEGWSLKQWLRNHEYRAWIGSAIMVASLVIWHLWW